jgi:hypothetical protein
MWIFTILPSSEFEPQSYRANIEDLRLDLYDMEVRSQSFAIQRLWKRKYVIIRGTALAWFLQGRKASWILFASWIKIRDLYKGNMGRYNFSGSNGLSKTWECHPLVYAATGAAEQALHADTPHLFEHIPTCGTLHQHVRTRHSLWR